jgi:hypothetical protein
MGRKVSSRSKPDNALKRAWIAKLENPLKPHTADLRLLITEHEAASMLGVSIYFLQRDRIGRRLIPFLRIAGMVRYCPEELYETISRWRAARDAAQNDEKTEAPA